MLDGLLGEQVAVVIGQPGAHGGAFVGFNGVLQYADPIPIAGLREKLGSRPARFYLVGDATTWFLIQKARFQAGRLDIDSDDYTAVHVHTDALQFTVTAPAADRQGDRRGQEDLSDDPARAARRARRHEGSE